MEGADLCISGDGKDDISGGDGVFDGIYYNLMLDRTFLGIYDSISRSAHYHGINCKLSGSVYVVSEIDGAVPLIHGPRSCAFHQRLSPRKLHSPVYNMACTNLEEGDIIYGGEAKLRRSICEVYNRYQPSLIVVLPTCISGLMGEDVLSVAKDVEQTLPCNVVYVPSEGFAHRDRDSIDSIMQYVATSWKKTSKEFDFRGCGQVDALKAIAEQLMEEQDVIENSVNLESTGRYTYGFNLEIQEYRRILAKMGTSINAVIPTSTVEWIKRAPAAQLNVVRSRTPRWADHMRDEFGIDQIKKWPHHSGIDGIGSFFLDLGSRLGLDGEAEEAIDGEKKRVSEELAKIRQILSAYDFAITSQNLVFNPYRAKVYLEDLRVPLKYICIDSRVLNRLKVSQATRNMMIKNMNSMFEELDSNFQVLMDPSAEELHNVAKKVDYVLGEFITSPVYEKADEIPILDVTPLSDLLYRTSFGIIVELGRRLVRMTNSPGRNKRHLIVSRFDYDSPYYPMLKDSRITSSISMWHGIWRANSMRGGS
ncbi:MAG TPA: nitrogenase component 1 [Methanothrix sp.]|nr:nitrogenase component 1 [Methanothrix sp.]